MRQIIRKCGVFPLCVGSFVLYQCLPMVKTTVSSALAADIALQVSLEATAMETPWIPSHALKCNKQMSELRRYHIFFTQENTFFELCCFTVLYKEAFWHTSTCHITFNKTWKGFSSQGFLVRAQQPSSISWELKLQSDLLGPWTSHSATGHSSSRL